MCLSRREEKMLVTNNHFDQSRGARCTSNRGKLRPRWPDGVAPLPIPYRRRGDRRGDGLLSPARARALVQRNGSRPCLAPTKVGDVEPKISEHRGSSFFPSVLERRRRIDRAPYAVIIGALVNGVPTLKVDGPVSALGVDAGMFKSDVSRIYASLNEEIRRFANALSPACRFPPSSLTPPT